MEKKKLWIIIGSAVLLVLILVTIFFVLRNRSNDSEIAIEQSPIASIVPSPSPSPSKTIIAKTKTEAPTSTPTPKTDEELIKDAFAKKFNTDASSITITISKKSDTAAFGGVSLKDEMSGGWFVAAKKDGEWKILADGNGVLMCSDLEGYDVPNTVVSECYDASTDSLKQR